MVKRFVAGAVCPECRAVDRLMVEVVGEETRRSCVDCGFEDSMDNSPSPAPPTSRLLRRPEPNQVQPVRIVTPSGATERSTGTRKPPAKPKA